MKNRGVNSSRTAKAARKAAPLASCDPTTHEKDYTFDELEFMRAVESYQNKTGRKFLTLCEHLAILKSLGYRKTEAADA